MKVPVHHRPGLNSKPFRNMYVEKAYRLVLLIAIRPSDGDVKLGGPLGAFREEQAMSRHRGFTFSLIIIPHNKITLHKQLHIQSH